MADSADMAERDTEAQTGAGRRKAQEALSAKGARYCADCGNEIAPARRLAMPSARRCLECQSAAERKQGKK